MSLVKLDRKDLKDAPFSPAVPAILTQPDTSIFGAIRAGDILLHHPYDSFSPVVEMIERASEDSKTVAIKMTLYRTNPDSGLIPALVRAAENGKQVAVLVELKARFDEENNITWAKALEQAGRPRRLRRRRPQDAREDRARRAAREGRDPPLRPPRDGQLQLLDGAHSTRTSAS